MKTLVHIDASVRPIEVSFSKQLAQDFQRNWQASTKGEVIYRDLSLMNLGHLDATLLGAYFTPKEQRTDKQNEDIALSETLIEELKSADHLLISTGMYNFGVTSQLKAYLDLVMRARETFQYGESGPEGLLKGLKATLIIATGGDYTQGAAASMDFVTPYLKTALGFMGIEVENVITAAGLAMGAENEAKAVSNAKQQVQSLFSS